MPVVRYDAREILCKVVYYGPARGGKTTNLQWIHRSLPDGRRPDLMSLATENDRTLFFDFLPLDLGEISGFRIRFQLYTVPGQRYYGPTRRLVLRGADGVVFVADSEPHREQDNRDSLASLYAELEGNGRERSELPVVFQYNKQDLQVARPVPELDAELNAQGAPSWGAAAIRGDGVLPTLRSISDRVLGGLSRPAPMTAPRA